MTMYVNPGNSGFAGIRNDIYVDKSGLISLINETIETPRRLTCISRPRRFGKSFAARMLCAYYDKTCDSSPLFDDLKPWNAFDETLMNAAELAGSKFIMKKYEWNFPK